MVHLNCPEKSLLRDSTLCEHSNFSREKQEAQARSEHRKWDSTPAAAFECEAPAARISHRQGSGEARRGRAVARPIWAPRRDDDPRRVPAWAAGIGAVRAPLGSSRFGARARCTCSVSRTGRRACIRWAASRYARSAFEARANRIALRLRHRAPRTDDGCRVPQDGGANRGEQGSLRFRCIRTCCGMHAGTSSPMTDRTRGRCNTTSGTRTFSTRCATRSFRRSGSNRFARIEGRPPSRGFVDRVKIRLRGLRDRANKRSSPPKVPIIWQVKLTHVL